MKTLIIVPAFNEGKSLAGVVTDLRSHGFKDIVVINDGSTDKTKEIAKKQHVILLHHLINRGLGAALGTGFEFAKRNNFDFIVTFDSDGQHKAKEIKSLLAPLFANTADVVIGKRILKTGQIPHSRKIMNFLANVATYAFFGIWTSDSQSGLRAFNKKAIASINIKADRMEVSSEFFREIQKNKLNLVEVPIEAVYTKYSMASSSQESLASVKMPIRLLLGQFRR